MTIMILGYIITVAACAYFVARYARIANDLELRRRNTKYWLDESNETLFVKDDELRVAYTVIDRYERILRDKYDHFNEHSSNPVADAINDDIVEDKIVCAGIYYDDDGNHILDKLDWTPQDGVTYSESDDSDV